MAYGGPAPKSKVKKPRRGKRKSTAPMNAGKKPNIAAVLNSMAPKKKGM